MEDVLLSSLNNNFYLWKLTLTWIQETGTMAYLVVCSLHFWQFRTVSEASSISMLTGVTSLQLKQASLSQRCELSNLRASNPHLSLDLRPLIQSPITSHLRILAPNFNSDMHLPNSTMHGINFFCHITNKKLFTKWHLYFSFFKLLLFLV